LGQTLQAAAFPTLKVPASQGVQLVALASANFPMTHGEHSKAAEPLNDPA
jgi:hypothetical protein